MSLLFRLLLVVLTLAACLAPLSASALPHHAERLTLGTDHPYFLYFDAEGNRTIAEIANLPASAFRPIQGGLTLSYTRGAAWVRFDLPLTTWLEKVWWLELQPPFLDDIQLYEPTESGWRLRRSGDTHLARQRELDYRFFVFRLADAAVGTEADKPRRTVYLRLASKGSLYLLATLYSPQQFAEGNWRISLRWGGYFGLLTLALLFMAAMVAITKSRKYGALSVGLAANGIHAANQQGFLSALVWGNWPGFADASTGVTAGLALAGTAWALREFFARDLKPSWVDRTYVAFIMYCLTLPLWLLTGGYGKAMMAALVLMLFATLGAIFLLLKRRTGFGSAEKVQLPVLCIFLFFYLLVFLPLLGFVPASTDLLFARNTQFVVYALLACGAMWLDIRATYGNLLQMREDELKNAQQAADRFEQAVHERTELLVEARNIAEEARAGEERAMLEQRQFLSMVSHEFRTPLAVIDSAAVNLSAVPPEDQDQLDERAFQIRRAARSLSVLVENLLSTEKLEQAGFSMVQEETELKPLLAEAAQLVAWSPRHVLKISCADDLGSWRLDAALFRVALSNLIDNAVKYSDEGLVELVAVLDEGSLLIQVKDQGRGIADANAEELFRKYARGTTVRKGKNVRGSGLGLFITKQIVEAHGGLISLASGRPGATVFEIRIPSP